MRRFCILEMSLLSKFALVAQDFRIKSRMISCLKGCLDNALTLESYPTVFALPYPTAFAGISRPFQFVSLSLIRECLARKYPTVIGVEENLGVASLVGKILTSTSIVLAYTRVPGQIAILAAIDHLRSSFRLPRSIHRGSASQR